MTPQEKAEELLRKMSFQIEWDAQPSTIKAVAKQCALIAVDEIIDCTKNGLGITKFSKEYWLEVKQEIEKP